jgi:hypothetical protein
MPNAPYLFYGYQQGRPLPLYIYIYMKEYVHFYKASSPKEKKENYRRLLKKNLTCHPTAV